MICWLICTSCFSLGQTEESEKKKIKKKDCIFFADEIFHYHFLFIRERFPLIKLCHYFRVYKARKDLLGLLGRWWDMFCIHAIRKWGKAIRFVREKGLERMYCRFQWGINQETELCFREQGVTGQAGSPGAPGNTGVKGTSGRQGAGGDQGDTGDTGETGPQGSPGNNGLEGEQGLYGPQGSKGAVVRRWTQSHRSFLNLFPWFVS